MLALAPCAHPPPPPPASTASPLLGRILPVPRGAMVQGRPIDTVELSGRPVLVTFFAEGCAGCLRVVPETVRVHHDHPEVVLIGVALDSDAEAVQRVIYRFAVPYPVVHDPQRIVAGRYRVDALPAVFVADRSGNVAWTGGPEQPDGAVTATIRDLLLRQPAP